MCKPKQELIPSVWRHTDYVAYRFDYYSIGNAKDEIAEQIINRFPAKRYSRHKLRNEDRTMISIDDVAYNLNLSIDEINNETVYHFHPSSDKDKNYTYEIYVGRYFSQIICRIKEIPEVGNLDFQDMSFLLDYMLHTGKLNMERMICVVHSKIEDTWKNISEKVEQIVLSDLRDNNVSQCKYTDTREIGDMILESSRTINRNENEQYKLEITGVSYYMQLTRNNFQNSYIPLMNRAILENTRYFIS